MAKIRKSEIQQKLFENIAVKVKENFSRSTNLKHSYNDSKALSQLILSEKFQRKFVHLAEPVLDNNSNQRVHVIAGTPGVGKSTFSVFFAKALAKSDSRRLNKVYADQTKQTSKVFKKASADLGKMGKILPVFLNGDEGEIEDAFYYALEDAFSQNGLSAEFSSLTAEDPKKMLKVLLSWKKDYPAKHDEFIEILSREEGLDVKELKAQLYKLRRPAQKIFSKIYSEVTGGASFSNYHHGQVVDLYCRASKALKQEYKGIFVFYDEFGKYLERGVRLGTDFDLQFLQDFAESCNRGGEEHLHLLLITHLPISQYAVRLPVSVQQEWSKIEGRFEQTNFNDGATSSYTIISSVFETELAQQSKALWKDVTAAISSWSTKNRSDKSLQNFKGTPNFDCLVANCYPLHPVSLAILPLLSEKVAQNERTLFSFLTRNEEGSLRWHLKREPLEVGNIEFLGPAKIYKYFRPLIANDVGVGGACRIGMAVDSALNELEEDQHAERDILSLIGISTIINNRSLLRVSQSNAYTLLIGLYEQKTVKAALEKLIKAKSVMYDRARDEYVMFYGSSIDLREEIAKVRQQKLTASGYLKVFERAFSPSFVIPNRYNFENGITRYFKEEVVSLEDLKSDKLNVDFYKEDGKVYYVATFSKDEAREALDCLVGLNVDSSMFIIPNKPLEIELELLELHAIDQLYSKKEILLGGPNVKKELDHYKKTALNILLKSSRILKSQSDMDAAVMYKGDIVSESIEGSLELSELVSRACEKEYSCYPIFNSELINKHKVSTPVIQGRIRLQNKLELAGEERFGIEGTGPEFALMKALCEHNKFNMEKDGKLWKINGLKKGSALESLYLCFEKFLEKSANGPRTIQELLDIWVKPPFGVREAFLPLYMNIFTRFTPSPVSYYLSDIFVKSTVTELFENILKQPKKYSIQMVKVDEKIEKYLEKLYRIVKEQMPFKVQIRKKPGFTDVAKIISKYYSVVPEFSRRNVSLSISTKKLIAALDAFSQPEKFILSTLPKIYTGLEFSDLSKDKFDSFLLELKHDLEKLLSIYVDLLKGLVAEFNQGLSELVRKTSSQRFKVIEKGDPLGQLWKSAIARLPDDVRAYPFSQYTMMLINRVIQLEEEMPNQFVVETLADSLTGESPKTWNEKGMSLFDLNLKQALSEIIRIYYLLGSDNKNLATFSTFDRNGKAVSKDIIHAEVAEEVYKIAAERVGAAIEGLDPGEQNEILLRLLLEINNEKTTTSKITNKTGIGAAWG